MRARGGMVVQVVVLKPVCYALKWVVLIENTWRGWLGLVLSQVFFTKSLPEPQRVLRRASRCVSNL